MVLRWIYNTEYHLSFSAVDSVEEAANLITGKEWVQTPPSPKPFSQQNYTSIFCDDAPGVRHEICHWLVATEEERAHPNLLLPAGADRVPFNRGPRLALLREIEAIVLESTVLGMGSPEAAELRSVYDRLAGNYSDILMPGYDAFVQQVQDRVSPEHMTILRSLRRLPWEDGGGYED